MLIVSGRFNITTEKPATQEYYLFSGLLSPRWDTVVTVVSSYNNIIIINSGGYITSNDALSTGWCNISCAYVCKI